MLSSSEEVSSREQEIDADEDDLPDIIDEDIANTVPDTNDPDKLDEKRTCDEWAETTADSGGNETTS